MTGEQKLAHANGQSLQGFYPQGTSWDLEIPADDLVKLFDQSVAEFADKPCMDFFDRKLTYKQMGEMVGRVAAGFQAQGVVKGTKVGLCMPNSPYYPVMMFAALKAGATVVNYNPTYAKEKLEHLVRDSGTEIMVTLDLKVCYPQLEALQKEGALKKLVVCPMSGMMPLLTGLGFNYLSGKRAKIGSGPGIVKFKSLTKNGVIAAPAAGQGISGDLAILQYTGGTTGMPKGAMLTHFNLAANAAQVEGFFRKAPEKGDHPGLLARGEEKVMGVLPFFHVFGLQISMITAFKIGGEVIIVPDPRDMKRVLSTIEKNKATLLPSVPRLLQAISEYKDVGKYDLTSLRLAVSGGAALASNVKAAFEKVTGCRIVQGYGLSETSPVASTETPFGYTDPASIGLPSPLTEIRIVDLNDPSKTLKIGETGEIALRGPQVMKGYFNDAAETAKVLTQDGWFLTGDIGHMDEKMFTTITDRKKRLIIVNGFNVYPAQVEKKIVLHPSVAECCVIKVADKSTGEAAKAFIRYLPDAKEKPTAAEMKAFLSQHLSPIETPKFFEFCEKDLPKTDIGKPDFKKLEEMEAAKAAAKTQKPAP